MTTEEVTPHRTFFKGQEPTRTDDAKAREAAEAKAWRECCKVVDFRDKRTCRACGRKSDPEAVGLTKRGHRHHIVYRSAGGEDISSNVITLCYECHDAEHVKRLLDVDGNADDAVAFWRRESLQHEWYLWRREIAVGVMERD